MKMSAPEITSGGVAQFTNDSGNLSAIFKIEFNRSNAIRFGKHILSPESPGNRPPPKRPTILALTVATG